MYMETQANLDPWATDSCCVKISLRTGTLIIAVISVVLQLLTGAAVVMISLECLEEVNTNCSIGNDTNNQSEEVITNHTKDFISNDEGCISGRMSVGLCQFPFWHEGRLYTAHDNINDTYQVATLCDLEHYGCQLSEKYSNAFTNCISMCQEHKTCDTVMCPVNMHCTENPSPACECLMNTTNENSSCVEDIKYNITGLEKDKSIEMCEGVDDIGSMEVDLIQCQWMPEPEKEFLNGFSQRTLYFLTGMLFAYLSTYLILSLCTIVGTIRCDENLLAGWVFFTWLHMGLIMADLLLTLHLTTLLHIISSVAYFVYSLYTWAVVKSHMFEIKVERNKRPLIEGILREFSIDGIGVEQIATGV